MRCKWEFRVSAGRPPLDAVSVVIVGSAGPGFARRMTQSLAQRLTELRSSLSLMLPFLRSILPV